MTGSLNMLGQLYMTEMQKQALEQAIRLAQQQLATQPHPLLGAFYGNRPPDPQIHGSSPNSTDQANQRANFAAQQLAAYTAGTRPAHIPFEDAGIRAGEVIGYRYWCIHQDQLQSMTSFYMWTPESMEANELPSENNNHGFYAYKDSTRAKQSHYAYTAADFGTVLMWGTIIEHQSGYRAQFAKVRSINKWLGPSQCPNWELRALRKAYGVE